VSVASAAIAANSATNLNTPNTIVKRDASGNINAGTVSATTFSGNGSGLTGLSASQMTTGTLLASQLPPLSGDVTGPPNATDPIDPNFCDLWALHSLPSELK